MNDGTDGPSSGRVLTRSTCSVRRWRFVSRNLGPLQKGCVSHDSVRDRDRDRESKHTEEVSFEVR